MTSEGSEGGRFAEIARECGFAQLGNVRLIDGGLTHVSMRAAGRLTVGINISPDDDDGCVRAKMERAFAVAGHEEPS